MCGSKICSAKKVKWKVSWKGTKKKKKDEEETRCLSGVLSMHSAEKLNLNRERREGRMRARSKIRGCGTCHDWLDVIGEIDWPRLTS